MSQLLPTPQAERTRDALSEYLRTSFNLADPGVRDVFDAFLADPNDGIFRGPYVRTRMPFKPVDDGTGTLDILPRGFTPYGHQAKAFARLSTQGLGSGERPKPTLVTTGTGSGKTEAFLFPILDHVVRHKRRGGTGLSGLILYPMNALATDQAQRLARLITSSAQLAGVRAAIYTGDGGDTTRSIVTPDGLINDRESIRENPPDILLTNYKMLDQLLLRPEDQKLWELSSLSLQYLVLDEFHTYDGAQGTDVSMLLRRLGLKLKSYWPANHPDISDADRARPLGSVTPVATSATLGDTSESGAGSIVDFAQTVFGEPFDAGTVVTESRYTVDEWAALPGDEPPAGRPDLGMLELIPLDPADSTDLDLSRALAWIKSSHESAPELAALRALATTFSTNFTLPAGTPFPADPTGKLDQDTLELRAKWQLLADAIGADTAGQLALIKQHPFIKRLLSATVQARSLDDLARELLANLITTPTGRRRSARTASPAKSTNRQPTLADASAFIGHIVAALSVIRSGQGLAAPTVDVHMWVRAVSRIDRSAGGLANSFSWSDDGKAVADGIDTDDGTGDADQLDSWARFPAIYCRNCGRSGWGVTAGPVGQSLAAAAQDKDIRAEKANRNPHFRALISGDAEADRFNQSGGSPDSRHENLAAFHVVDREIIDPAGVFVDANVTPEIEKERAAGKIQPVLVFSGTDADQKSVDDYCPACGERDSIRFLGAAVATLLSVTLSTLFGDQALTAAEKKSLVFTDSVQDAAHRAGFVESRSHVLTRRNVIAHAVGDGGSLALVADRLVRDADRDSERRYRILPPEFSQDRFPDVHSWWSNPGKANLKAQQKVEKRLAFDAALEFGLQSRYGRTLSTTGTVAAEVVLPDAEQLASLAGEVLAAAGEKYGELPLGSVGTGDGGSSGEVGGEGTPGSGFASGSDVSRLRAAWVRGVAERLRTQGAIHHPWLDKYISDGGFRIWIWGKRRKSEGMPAFPGTRNGPAFAITGSGQKRKRGKSESLFDAVEARQGWYAEYTAKMFGLGRQHAAAAVKLLLQTMAQGGLIREFNVAQDPTAKVYGLDPQNVQLERPYEGGDAGSGEGGATAELKCAVCQAEFPMASDALEQLDGTPCLMARCTGTLERATIGANFYRRLYTSSEMNRIVAREHSGILEPEVRKAYEDGFKAAQRDPSAPNVLVATPTLEMGIDIGDLSAVMLASLPRTVASYVQRVGRAGRLTGNALNLAFVEGRGRNLPTVQNPLSMINGAVRPPATYLDAVEMIKRQYLAFLMDKLAGGADAGSGAGGADPVGPVGGPAAAAHDLMWPRMASGVFTGDAGQSAFLNRVVALNDAHHAEFLDEFLATFGDNLKLAGEELRAWATPKGEGHSGLRDMIWAAHRAFNQQIESLRHRQAEITKALPELVAAVGSDPDTASEEARRALQEAKAADGATSRALSDLSGEYWISALESAQLLPNYTLLDDTTELSVDMRWRDEDTQEFKNARVNFDRGAKLALRDFAPGATFYGRGMQIRIDALDRGPNDQDQYILALCGECGYSVELREHEDHAPSTCPRCQDGSIADVGQHLPAVHLRRVSAMVNRDESAIDDADDDRRQRSFTVQSLADVDMSQAADRWYVDGFNFGVAYLKNVTVTSVNFGPRGTGREVVTGGDTVKSPGFVICESCGKLDSATNGNQPTDHRPWCKHRRAFEEHNVQVVLTHRLRTQGSLIRLPENLLIGDQAALPSLVAALRLGLAKHLGGDPDHINVMMAREPILSGGTSTGVADALLLHDTVPGGTGYLADLSRPETVWGILLRAWQVVSQCHCAHEEKWACGDCLLPYATYSDTGNVSRASAQGLLEEILKAGRDVSVEDAPLWPVTTVAPTPQDPESYLEKSFRRVFRDRLEKAGLDVQERPGATGVEWTIQQPASHVRWSLRSQESVGGFTRPDFILQCELPSIPPVEIYTDGFAYHASHAHNNVRADAEKRAQLRGQGHAVVSITADEVRRAESGASPDDMPTWFDTAMVPTLNRQEYGWSSQSAGYLGNPVDLLISLVQSVSRESQDVPRELRHAASGMPVFLANPGKGARPVVLPDGADLGQLAQAVARHVTGTAELGAASAAVDANGNRLRIGLLREYGPLTVLVELLAGGHSDVVAVLDDRDAALDDARFREAWAGWLHLSNFAGFREAPNGSVVASVTQLLAEMPVEAVGAAAGGRAGQADFVAPDATFEVSAADAAATPDSAVAVAGESLPDDWQQLLASGGLEPEERDFLLELRRAGVTELPEVGEESDDGVPMDLSWPDSRVVVLLDPEPGDVADLEIEGWRVVSAQAVKVKEALAGAAGAHGTEGGGAA